MWETRLRWEKLRLSRKPPRQTLKSEKRLSWKTTKYKPQQNKINAIG